MPAQPPLRTPTRRPAVGRPVLAMISLTREAAASVRLITFLRASREAISKPPPCAGFKARDVAAGYSIAAHVFTGRLAPAPPLWQSRRHARFLLHGPDDPRRRGARTHGAETAAGARLQGRRRLCLARQRPHGAARRSSQPRRHLAAQGRRP